MTLCNLKRFTRRVSFQQLGVVLVDSLCATHAAASEVACKPRTQLDVSKIDAQIVLIGEPHGTNEIPAFTAGFVCSLLRSGKSVILAIECNGEEQDGLNRYLESDGSEVDRTALLQADSWHASCQDGRTSRAMLTLIESMRELRRAGQRVGILAMGRNENLKCR